MRIVRCPRCGRENRSALSLTLCDGCGYDISTLGDSSAQPLHSFEVPEVTVIEPIVAATDQVEVPPVVVPQPSPSRDPLTRILWALLRLMCAAFAAAAGVYIGRSLTMGSALSSDTHLAGSVAILAAAVALSGFVLILVGPGAERVQGITLGLRALGFILVVLGIWAVTSITYGPVLQSAVSTPIGPPPVAIEQMKLKIREPEAKGPPAQLKPTAAEGPPLYGPLGPPRAAGSIDIRNRFRVPGHRMQREDTQSETASGR
ncbi:MAG: hypothetical protein ACUVX8_08045 [Candidatus Zipacnadales bacterium]